MRCRRPWNEIRRLNPSPGGQVDDSYDDKIQQVVPDFRLDYENGELILSMPRFSIPELRIKREYADILESGRYSAERSQKEAATFVKQKIDSAKWFIEALRQRQNTLESTMRAIIEYQHDYFIDGDESSLRPMVLKDIYIETYGCQMNVSDTEVIFSILGKEGYQRTASMEEADVILANTCSVRDNAEQRIWGRIELFHKQKQIRKDVIVGIVGCMAERLKDKLIETGKVDLVAGPDSYRSLPRLLRDIAPDKPQIDVLLSHEETYADIVPVRTDRAGVSAFISIMRGCNNVCSYCVVPYTRGAERSRDPETIVAEARDVFAKGYREVTLLGQNVDSYHWKCPENSVTFRRTPRNGGPDQSGTEGQVRHQPPQGHQRRPHRDHGQVREHLPPHPPAGTVGEQPSPGKDEEALHKGMVP